jgi:hypothetical protein
MDGHCRAVITNTVDDLIGCRRNCRMGSSAESPARDGLRSGIDKSLGRVTNQFPGFGFFVLVNVELIFGRIVWLSASVLAKNQTDSGFLFLGLRDLTSDVKTCGSLIFKDNRNTTLEFGGVSPSNDLTRDKMESFYFYLR